MSVAHIARHVPTWIAVALTAAFLVAGCDTGPLFRDNYWGKSILQPDMVLRPAERDAYGNPIIEE